jgi:hypothetical protein
VGTGTGTGTAFHEAALEVKRKHGVKWVPGSILSFASVSDSRAPGGAAVRDRAVWARRGG